jgi:RNA polymerase sigma-70 factor, ECF subfamily
LNNDADGDDALVDRLARTGDARAFDALYRRHATAVYSTAARIARDTDVAADIAHDAWVRAVETLHRFEKRSSFRTWITGILINCYREHDRARKRDRGRDEDAGDSGDDVIDEIASPSLDDLRVDPIDLEAAIAALSPRFRQVLVLHDVEGFTHEEIAEMLGLVPGTSKSQLARARRRLREMLDAGIPRGVS